jgi:hypothetical protein
MGIVFVHNILCLLAKVWSFIQTNSSTCLNKESEHLYNRGLRPEAGRGTKKKLLNWWYRPSDGLIHQSKEPYPCLKKGLRNVYNEGNPESYRDVAPKDEHIYWNTLFPEEEEEEEEEWKEKERIGYKSIGVELIMNGAN